MMRRLGQGSHRHRRPIVDETPRGSTPHPARASPESALPAARFASGGREAVRPADLQRVNTVAREGEVESRGARPGEGSTAGAEPARMAPPRLLRCGRALTPAPLPFGLADSHIALRGHEGGAAFGGLELEPALEHDDWSGLAVVAGPSAEAGADPRRIGERAPGVGVALSFGLAFEALAQGF